jgi:hypothetical protein
VWAKARSIRRLAGSILSLSDRLHKLLRMNSRAPRPRRIRWEAPPFSTTGPNRGAKGRTAHRSYWNYVAICSPGCAGVAQHTPEWRCVFRGKSFNEPRSANSPESHGRQPLEYFLLPLSSEDIAYLLAPERYISINEFARSHPPQAFGMCSAPEG